MKVKMNLREMLYIGDENEKSRLPNFYSVIFCFSVFLYLVSSPHLSLFHFLFLFLRNESLIHPSLSLSHFLSLSPLSLHLPPIIIMSIFLLSNIRIPSHHLLSLSYAICILFFFPVFYITFHFPCNPLSSSINYIRCSV